MLMPGGRCPRDGTSRRAAAGGDARSDDVSVDEVLGAGSSGVDDGVELAVQRVPLLLMRLIEDRSEPARRAFLGERAHPWVSRAPEASRSASLIQTSMSLRERCSDVETLTLVDRPEQRIPVFDQVAERRVPGEPVQAFGERGVHHDRHPAPLWCSSSGGLIDGVGAKGAWRSRHSSHPE